VFLNVSKNLALFLQDLASQARCYIGKRFNKCQTITLVKAFYFGKSILFWLKKKVHLFHRLGLELVHLFHWYTKKVHPSTPFSLAPFLCIMK